MPVEPIASIPPPSPDPPTDACATFDGLPEVEVFDIDAQAWRRLPHFSQGSRYVVADPGRYVDPTTGTVLVRYVNDRNDPVNVVADVTISGTVR
jgi:hypothetical protein